MASKYTIFVLMNATTAWLSMTNQERREHTIHDLGPIIQKYPQVSVELYDAEAYTAHCSDIAVMRTEDLNGYADFMDELRKSPLFVVPYYELVEILPTMQNDYLAAAGAR